MVAQPVERQARVWKRILAFVTDFFFVIVLCSVLLVTGTAALSEQAHTAGEALQLLSESASQAPSATQQAVAFYFALFFFLYHFFSEYIVGQTAGMLLWGLHVKKNDVNEKQKESKKNRNESKSSLRASQAFLRNLFICPLLPGILLPLVWAVDIGYYVLQGRRLFEKISHTDTVEYVN